MKTLYNPPQLLEDIQKQIEFLRGRLSTEDIAHEYLSFFSTVDCIADDVQRFSAVQEMRSERSIERGRLLLKAKNDPLFKRMDGFLCAILGEKNWKAIRVMRYHKKTSEYYRKTLELFVVTLSAELQNEFFTMVERTHTDIEADIKALEELDAWHGNDVKVRDVWKRLSAYKQILEGVGRLL